MSTMTHMSTCILIFGIFISFPVRLLTRNSYVGRGVHNVGHADYWAFLSYHKALGKAGGSGSAQNRRGRYLPKRDWRAIQPQGVRITGYGAQGLYPQVRPVSMSLDCQNKWSSHWFSFQFCERCSEVGLLTNLGTFLGCIVRCSLPVLYIANGTLHRVSAPVQLKRKSSLAANKCRGRFPTHLEHVPICSISSWHQEYKCMARSLLPSETLPNWAFGQSSVLP